MSRSQDLHGRTPVLTVIIVAYKSETEIGPCLASLPRRIGGGLLECIVVNNSHGDATSQIIARDHAWVEYVNPGANLGFGRANNLGFARARGEHVLFLNPDTVSNAEAFEHCLLLLQRDPGVGLVSPRLVMADGRMDLACRRSIPTLWDGFCRASGLALLFPGKALFAGYNLTHLDERGRHEVGAINGAFMMGRRAVLEAIADDDGRAVFDEAFFMYGDDLDLCIRIRKAGYRIVYEGAVQITHLKGVSVGKDYDRMSLAIFDANRDVYLKHFNPGNSSWTRWKYEMAFGLWKRVALWRAKLRGHRAVRPV